MVYKMPFMHTILIDNITGYCLYNDDHKLALYGKDDRFLLFVIGKSSEKVRDFTAILRQSSTHKVERYKYPLDTTGFLGKIGLRKYIFQDYSDKNRLDDVAKGNLLRFLAFSSGLEIAVGVFNLLLFYDTLPIRILSILAIVSGLFSFLFKIFYQNTCCWTIKEECIVHKTWKRLTEYRSEQLLSTEVLQNDEGKQIYRLKFADGVHRDFRETDNLYIWFRNYSTSLEDLNSASLAKSKAYQAEVKRKFEETNHAEWDVSVAHLQKISTAIAILTFICCLTGYILHLKLHLYCLMLCIAFILNMILPCKYPALFAVTIRGIHRNDLKQVSYELPVLSGCFIMILILLTHPKINLMNNFTIVLDIVFAAAIFIGIPFAVLCFKKAGNDLITIVILPMLFFCVSIMFVLPTATMTGKYTEQKACIVDTDVSTTKGRSTYTLDLMLTDGDVKEIEVSKMNFEYYVSQSYAPLFRYESFLGLDFYTVAHPYSFFYF